MITRYEAILNGVALSSISPEIVITDINYATPSVINESYMVAKRQGARIRRRHVDRNTVTVYFMLRAYDVAQRQEICNAIAQWAKNGGVLETNDRPGQRLRCVCDLYPTVVSALKWTDVLRVSFSAYALPFWEEKYPSILTIANATSTGASGTLYVPGNVDDALVECKITANASVTQVTMTVNGKQMILDGLSLSSGQIVNLTYDEDLIQSIKVGTTSLLNKRVGVDDLLVKCGETNTFAVSADASTTVEFSVRGLWL